MKGFSCSTATTWTLQAIRAFTLFCCFFMSAPVAATHLPDRYADFHYDSDRVEHWDFNVTHASYYKLQVRHNHDKQIDYINKKGKVTYIIKTDERTLIKNDIIRPNQLSIKFLIRLIKPQKVHVTVKGGVGMTELYFYDQYDVLPGKWYDPNKGKNFTEARVVKQILDTPDAKLDLASVKLTIDNMIVPSIDVDQGIQLIDAMVADISRTLPHNAKSIDKLIALKKYLYEAGVWNNWKPYQYDFSDPLGTKISNKLLVNYINSRKGNCVSMPILFTVLGDRLGLNLTLSHAPLHLFVKYTDDDGKAINLETTSGANPARDEWYQQTMSITDTAIANGLYLRTMSRKETVVAFVTVLAEHYMHIADYEKALAISELIIHHDPKNVAAMLRIGSAYGRLGQTLFGQYQGGSYIDTLNQIPRGQKDYFLVYAQRNRGWFAKAEQLGWRPPQPDDEKRYLKMLAKDAK